MILTDREIEIALSHQQIFINPPPNLDDTLSSTSLDLRLSNKFEFYKAKRGFILNPGENGYSHSQTDDIREAVESDTYLLKSKEFVLAWTKEKIDLPLKSRIAARVEGKSSMARLGVCVHITAPTIHCGFKGSIQLEMFNFSPYDINLTKNMKICQLIFEYTAGTPNKGYLGSFLGSVSA